MFQNKSNSRQHLRVIVNADNVLFHCYFQPQSAFGAA